MMTMLLVVFICCQTTAAGLPYHAAPQITLLSVNKQAAIHQIANLWVYSFVTDVFWPLCSAKYPAENIYSRSVLFIFEQREKESLPVCLSWFCVIISSVDYKGHLPDLYNERFGIVLTRFFWENVVCFAVICVVAIELLLMVNQPQFVHLWLSNP